LQANIENGFENSESSHLIENRLRQKKPQTGQQFYVDTNFSDCYYSEEWLNALIGRYFEPDRIEEQGSIESGDFSFQRWVNRSLRFSNSDMSWPESQDTGITFNLLEFINDSFEECEEEIDVYFE
jgi:hypothetical protein